MSYEKGERVLWARPCDGKKVWAIVTGVYRVMALVPHHDEGDLNQYDLNVTHQDRPKGLRAGPPRYEQPKHVRSTELTPWTAVDALASLSDDL